MAAVTALAVTAAAGAYSAYSSNKAGKEAQKQRQRELEAAAGPVSNNPYGPAEDDVQYAIDEARRLYDAGLHQQAARALRKVPGASDAFSSLVGDITDRARNPSETLQAGQRYIQDILGGGSAPPAGGLDPAMVRSAKRFWDGGASEEEAMRRATEFARANPESALGRNLAEREAAREAAGPAGPFARNPIYNELYGSVTGTNMDRSYDLLSDFIGGGSGGAGAGGAAGGGEAGPAAMSGPEWDAFAERAAKVGFSDPEKAIAYVQKNPNNALGKLYQAAESAQAARPTAQASGPEGPLYRPPGGGAGVTGGGGFIPDTMSQGGFYADQAEKFFDPSVLDPTNDPTLQPYIDALKQQMGDAFNERADLIGDRFSASNTFNSSARSLALGDASGEMDQALSAELARVYMGSRSDALDRQMALLSGISARDLAAMGDSTARYGIDTSASVAREGIGAQSARDASSAALAERAQNLQAIFGIQAGDQYGMDLLSGLGGALDAEQFGALGAIPGMEGVEQDWYGMALGGQQGVDSANRARAGARANASANAALAPGADLDAYLRRIMGPATAFSTRTGTAPEWGGYTGPSSGEAILGGLLGGAAAGAGAYMQYGGAG